MRRGRGDACRGGFTRAQALAALGLDVTFDRGEGSRLRLEDGDGSRWVWDFLGGYGSTFHGHNHPELVAALKGFLDHRRVTHGQASAQPRSTTVRQVLSARLEEALGQPYEVVLSNTGSEAVEAAARHAELVLARRAARLGEEVAPCLPQPVRWTPAAARILADLGVGAGPESLAALADHNRTILSTRPVHVSVEGGYHGSTARALALTHAAPGALGERGALDGVHFVDPEAADGVERAFQELRRKVLRPYPTEGGWELEEVAWLPVAALFLEPLQGEGGIRPLAPGVLEVWQATCERWSVPVVADEIQSGMGRTGTFLFCQQVGLRPDYVLLGKSLGGGLAKISALGVGRPHALADFTLKHLSTFAEDELSSVLALRALELLDEESAARRASEVGEGILSRLADVAARHPRLISEVRGRGLMIGIEFRPSVFDRSNALDWMREYGWLGYAISSFLLHRHGIRVAPALSAGRTIRIEPAYDVPEEAVDRLVAAVEDLCNVLGDQDAGSMLAPSLGIAETAERREPPLTRVVRRPEETHVGFVGHFIEAEDVGLWDPNLRRLGREACETFLDRVYPLVEPVLVKRERVESASGRTATLSFIGLAVPSRRFFEGLRGPERHALRGLVQRAVDRAAAEGCSLVGLGGYCSIITRNGKELRSNGTYLTTGNGYTVGAALTALEEGMAGMGVCPADAHAAVIGATGNIGSVVAHLLAGRVRCLTVIGRPSRKDALDALADRLTRAGEGGTPVRVDTRVEACLDADLVVAASNSAAPVVRAEHISDRPVLLVDLSVPADVESGLEAERPNTRVIRGGVIRAPSQPDWSVPGIPLEPGLMYACMAETVMMGMDGVRGHGSFGALTPARVRETLAMAERHGFTTVHAVRERSY